MSLIFYNPPSLPYPLEKVFINTALTNRKFYEKERQEFFPSLYSLEKELPNIKAPALIIWGDQDKILNISCVPVFEKGLKNHNTVIIKDCGHIPGLERPQETATHYIAFINGIKI
jgi:pimeloyl-ACP methyl ester carboxylesterase